MEYPILRYPDLAQDYVLYTDASGIGWSGVLMQEHTDDKGKTKQHPICYVSGQFHGHQLNWAALTKEAYAIYMAIKRLSFYMTDTDFTIRSNHLPLKKFLNKQTMNSKVNNWALELEQFRLHLEWIPGSWITDSLSHLIDVVPDVQQPDEPKDHEFRSYCFEELEPAKVMEIVSTKLIEMQIVTSELVECLRKLWKSPVKEDIHVTHEEKQEAKWEPHSDDSEFSNCSQNLRISPEIGTFMLQYEEKSLNKQKLLDDRESSELSQKLQRDSCIEIPEHETIKEIKLPLKPKQLQELQKNDIYWRDISRKLHKNCQLQKIFIKEKGVLYKMWTEDGRTFKCILVPQVLQDSVIILAHDHSRHNGARRTYNCLRK